MDWSAPRSATAVRRASGSRVACRLSLHEAGNRLYRYVGQVRQRNALRDDSWEIYCEQNRYGRGECHDAPFYSKAFHEIGRIIFSARRDRDDGFDADCDVSQRFHTGFASKENAIDRHEQQRSREHWNQSVASRHESANDAR